MARAVSGDAARYRVLAACTLGTIVSMTPAVHSVFGLFLLPLSETFQWPRAQISVVLGMMAVVGAVVYPLAGRFADGHGARRMLIVANLVFGVAIAALALTTRHIGQFYLTFFIVSLAGSVAGTPLFSKVIAEWFDKGRGMALGISAGMGSGVGSIAIPVIAAMVVGQYGWRAGYLAIGAIVLIVGFPALFLMLRDAPRSVVAADADTAPSTEGLSLAEAARMPRFWVLLVSIAVGAGTTTAIFSHVVPIVVDRGFSISAGTAAVSMFALVGSTWQIATGRVLDRSRSPKVVIPMYAMAVVGLALLELGMGTPALMLGGALLGVGLGAQYGTMPYLIARYFGLRAFGTIIGVMYSAVIVAQGVTPVLLDAAYDAQGNYRMGVLVCALCLSAGAALMLLLPRYQADEAASPSPLALA
ncbi:MFS transporter [Sphingomonas hengshuiensis]|uniref:MFS transporter n=1 Tax=Sphingomonas hengshuiensis TaxID=1609977 RepID=A0A7U4J6T1_9SPHN|nr:MFS transporter [Sphingomonas hengshuiensis]AJP71297.1 MFS transporter [Sphingomonas hengshuiensis]